MKAHKMYLLLLLGCSLVSCSGVGKPLEPPRTFPGPQLALDTTFGVAGEVTSDFGRNEALAGIVLQVDGKIVMAGGARDDSTGKSDLTLARYLPDGRLDPNFGTEGYVFTPAGSDTTAPNQGAFEVVELQPDGKILAAGYAVLNVVEHYTPGAILARYTPDGSLDASFGVGGLAQAEPGTGSITALEVQPDGKIVTARNVWSADETVLSRYTPDGQPEPSFGLEGTLVLTSRPTGLSEDPSLIQLPDGGFVLSLDTRLVWLNADGARDERFGESGEVDTGYAITALAKQEDGAVVVAQYSVPDYSYSDQGLSVQTSPVPVTDFRLMRYTSDGELDLDFGEQGTVITDINSSEWIESVVIQSDGKIIAAGRTQNAVAVVRYTASGVVDASFVGAFGGAHALAPDDQNRMVVGGERLRGDGYDFALARLLP